MSTAGTNGAPQADPGDMSQIPASLKADIALLRALLQDDALSGEHDNLDEPGLEELLQKLDTADDIARGVESRLDVVLNHLDGLLESLEVRTGEIEAASSGLGGVVAEEATVIAERTSVAADGFSVQVTETVSLTEARS